MATYTTNYNLEKPEATDPFGDFRESYNDNLDIIDANLGGGGGSGNVDDVMVNGVSVVDGNKVAQITSYKEVTQAEYDALPATKLTDGIAYFIKDGGGSGGSCSFLLIINAETGETVTATKGGTTLTATEVSTGIYEVEITSSGTWTISDGNNTATVDVGVYTATLSSIPDGSTVTPTDDVSIWLACGGRTENYTTIGEVLSDSTCLLALLSDNNANDYLVRSTTWASTITADSSAMTYIGLDNYCANTLLANATWCNAICNSTYFESVLNVKVPTMTSDTTPSGVCSASSVYQTYYAYKAFDGNTESSNYWSANTGVNSWLQYQFVSAIMPYMVKVHGVYADGHLRIKNFTVQGSNDGVTFTDIKSFQTIDKSGEQTFEVGSINNYSYLRISIADNWSESYYIRLHEVQFYGRKDV